MTPLRYTLEAEGSSDAMLRPVIEWVVSRLRPGLPLVGTVADFRVLPARPSGIGDRVRSAIELYPCDVLFVHRDAEKEPAKVRHGQIKAALAKLGDGLTTPVVQIVPVRMSEAWLLIDEPAIRAAAGNPNGTTKLDVPKPNQLERLPDPKERLYELLRTASGLTGRHAKKFHPSQRVRRVAEEISDFTPLDKLPAFQTFTKEVQAFLDRWRPPAE